MATPSGVAPARDAATVILLKQPDLIYMTRRPTSLRVAGGYYVFPGGAVEEHDYAYAEARPDELAAVGLEDEHRVFVAAALRETFEEVGVLLAADENGRALWRPEGAAAHGEALAEARDRLIRGGATLLDIVAKHRWTLSGELLGYVARWVTPPAARRRFNTRFFVADVTGGHEPVPYAAEVAEGFWLPLSEAVARHEAGTMPLMRPTRALIRELADNGGTVQAMRRFLNPASERREVIEQNTPEVLLSVLASQGVTMVPVPSPTLLPATETNVYVVTHGGEAVLIDAGHGGDAGIALVRAAWERLHRPHVKAILLTHGHPDHAGGVAALQQAFECPVWAHPAAADVLRTQHGTRIDKPLVGGEEIAIGRMHLDVFHAPGHAPDHLCFFLRERGIVFTGDNVVGEGSSWIGPPDGDMTQYLASLRKLQQLPARVIAPGHGPALDEPAARMEALIQRRLAREADIVRLLGRGAATVQELTNALYGGQVPGSVMEMARRTVEGHLIKLEREDRVRSIGDGHWRLMLHT